MKNIISMDKQYKTRSGVEARILCLDASSENGYPVVALLNGNPVQFTEDGHFFQDEEEHNYDLIEVKEEIVLYLEVFTYDNGIPRIVSHKTKEAFEESIKVSAACNKDYRLIATKQITITEGERV